MIKAENLTKTYTTEQIQTTALNGLNIEIEQGEFCAVMGPSGCGKSTLMNVLGLLDNPTDGKYYFLDENVSGQSERERAQLRKGNIGFVFQSFNLIDELSVFENVELSLLYMGAPSGERKEKVEAALKRMDMMHRRDHFPQQLSGGQQQRVAIARATVADAKLILADEPTGNLDSDRSNEVMHLLAELNEQDTTIVMATHSPHDADYARRVIHLFDGQLAGEDIQEGFHV